VRTPFWPAPRLECRSKPNKPYTDKAVRQWTPRRPDEELKLRGSLGHVSFYCPIRLPLTGRVVLGRGQCSIAYGVILQSGARPRPLQFLLPGITRIDPIAVTERTSILRDLLLYCPHPAAPPLARGAGSRYLQLCERSRVLRPLPSCPKLSCRRAEAG
jgi:hypothetical protein